MQAHDALVALRPARQAARTAWVEYHRRSSAVYRQVAEVDRGHRGHALYWAEREKAKADDLTVQLTSPNEVSPGEQRSTCRAGRKPSRSIKAASTPTRLDGAQDALVPLQPEADAAPEAWLAYHRYAASVFAEIAEVDRAHHHESLACFGMERQKAAELAKRLGVPRRAPKV